MKSFSGVRLKSARHRSSLSMRQSGAVLIVAMIMVLIMTIAGLAAIRGSGLQELMVGNMRDIHLRLQAAEVGLRVGESYVNWKTPSDALPFFDGSTPGRLPDQNLIADAIPVSAWKKEQWETSNSVVAPIDISNMGSRPRYVIERVPCIPVICSSADGGGVDQHSQDIAPDKQVFRVSSYYGDSGSGASVYLQSLYKY